jgi:DNA modification methylase
VPKPRANALNGTAWLRYSISVWNDLRKTPEETALGHPALFPVMLVDRLLQCFVKESDRTVLDPFAGGGSTLLAACGRGLNAIGIDLSPDYVAVARQRLLEAGSRESHLVEGQLAEPGFCLVQADARELGEIVAPGSIDFCATSPPYWDILRQRRTADGQPSRHYGDRAADLGRIEEYDGFLAALSQVFAGIWACLRPGGYCCVVVMDLRKGSQFFPLHQHLADSMQELGFIYDDLIIWDRRADYSNLRPLGYPCRFRVNKIHEFVLIFLKPVAG